MNLLILLSVLSSLLAFSSAASPCPMDIAQREGNYTEDPTMGCIYADGELEEQFDLPQAALARCRLAPRHLL